MKLLNFRIEDTWRLGIKTEQGVIDVALAAEVLDEGDIPGSVQEAIERGGAALSALRRLVDRATVAGEKPAYLLDESVLAFGPCVTRPNKIICVGLNYRKHAEETNAAVPQTPILFSKFNNTLAGHGHEIEIPKTSAKVDYEAELAIVIGTRAKDVARERALGHVFGYCCANDLSARDLQNRTQQWLLGKTCDGFAPLGPYLVTADAVGNPNRLDIKCFVNGEVRQSSNTSDMIFYCDEIVSYISRHFTLEPGDVILTGTPEGVIFGYPHDKQVYLKDGDVVTIEIDEIGALTNRMKAEA